MSASLRKIFNLVEPGKDRMESTDWTRRLSFKVQFPKSLSRSASIMSPQSKKALARVLSNIKGCITTPVLPPLGRSPSTEWTEEPCVFVAGDTLMCQELARIELPFHEARLQSSACNPLIITSEVEDCRTLIEENGLISFVPLTTELGDLCCFPESDSVAILRITKNAGRIVG